MFLKPGTRTGTRGRGFAAAFAAASLCSLALASTSLGAAQTITAADDFYSAASYGADQGDVVPFQNIGLSSHDATARGSGADGGPLFFLPSIGTGSSTVKGTQYLTTGTYAFYCTVHPLSMSANLVVSSNGTPAARPRIMLSTKGAKRSKVAKKGKLPVRVTAVTASEGIELTVKLGKATVGTAAAFNLAAGQSKTVSVKLNKAAKSKLASDAKSVTLKASGDVPFGAPGSAKATLK